MSSSSLLTITLQLTTHPAKPTPSFHAVTLPRTSSIKDLKQRIALEWDGKPAPDGIVFVLGGRVCRDADIVGDLFPLSGDEPFPAAILHVIIKGSAWTTPFTNVTPPSPSVPVPTPTTPQPQPAATAVGPASANGYTPSYLTPTPPTPLLTPSYPSNLTPPVPSLGPSVSGYPTYLAFVSQLIPLQRALLLLNLQKAHYEYEEAVRRRRTALRWGEIVGAGAELERASNEDPEVEREEIRMLLVDCGLWGMVREKEEEAVLEVEQWGAARENAHGEFQVVQIGGLPFILHMPVGYLATPVAPPLKQYQSLKRAEEIHHILTTMLQLLITYQPTSPAIAYGRALLRPTGAAGAPGAHHPPAAVAADDVVPRGAAGPAARRRATLSIVINLEAMLSILIPLFLLSLKLAFLLWIFGRHASASKRAVLFTMAVGWVVWEGWVMQRRRAAVGVGRDRLERVNRRVAAAAAAANGGPANGGPVGAAPVPRRAAAPDPAMLPGGGGAQPAPAPRPRDPAAAPRQPRPAGAGAPRAVPRVREPVSRLSPRYWLNWIAAIGLAEEARELGLVPRLIAGRPVVHAPAQAVVHRNDRAGLAAQARKRAFRTALVAVVLFFGTLSPEVEKKRKRALEKRERLLAQRRVAREKKAEAAALAAAATDAPASAVGVPVGGEGVEANVPVLPEAVQEVLQARGLEVEGRVGTASGTSTPGVFDVEEPPELKAPIEPTPPTPTISDEPGLLTPTLAASTSGDPLTSTSAASLPELVVESSTPTSPGARTPLVGRAAISDAELFVDGLGEANEVLGPAEDDLALAEAQVREDAVAEGRVEDTETDEEEEEEREREEREADAGVEGEVDQIVALF